MRVGVEEMPRFPLGGEMDDGWPVTGLDELSDADRAVSFIRELKYVGPLVPARRQLLDTEC